MFRRTLLSTRFTPSIIYRQQARFISTELKDALDKAVTSTPVVLFMKGTPEFPQCGFSRATIQTLGNVGVDPNKFAAYNVLEDEELRNGIKEYSSWPTIPQLYVNGEFIGGCDIITSMASSGELAELLEEQNALVPEEEEIDEVESADVKPNRK
ncbi:GRX5 Monothiol glutaredoxin-5 [Candida maltosa Xu316]|uniref:Monothiol glutaredoxin-5, mitochondrial n=1 Tax=Candida maltosa (strain Xu316) TaxID=1245528 RepID=M3JS16_CANMX|nr:putative mitochondrial glutaredoxin [Candida maltosa Xu316]